MARQKKPVHRVQMTEGKRNIIHQFLEEYDIQTTAVYVMTKGYAKNRQAYPNISGYARPFAAVIQFFSRFCLIADSNEC